MKQYLRLSGYFVIRTVFLYAHKFYENNSNLFFEKNLGKIIPFVLLSYCTSVIFALSLITIIKGVCLVEIKERRKYKRLPIELNLEVDELFKQDNVVVKNLGASISVYNISKSGIGFVSEADLPVGYYFRGTINFTNGDFFRVVMRIVRSQKMEGKLTAYGAEFVGLAPFLADKVDKYEKSLMSR